MDFSYLENMVYKTWVCIAACSDVTGTGGVHVKLYVTSADSGSHRAHIMHGSSQRCCLCGINKHVLSHVRAPSNFLPVVINAKGFTPLGGIKRPLKGNYS